MLDGGVHVDGGVGAGGVVPVHLLGGGDLDIVDGLPGSLVADEFGLVQRVLGQFAETILTVVRVALRPDGVAVSQ